MAGLNTAEIKDRARNLGINLSESDASAILSQAWDQSQYGADEGAVMSLLGGMGGGGGGGGGGSGSGGSSSPDDFIAKIRAELEAQMNELTKRTNEFDAKNPFAFDDAMAKKSAEERFNPYYDAELKDMIGGVQRAKSSVEGEKQLLMDLNRVQVGADKRNLDEAIRQSEEGYAGAGLFFSGARERGTGMQQIQGNEQAQSRDLSYNANLANIQRRAEDVNTQASSGQRKLLAEKTTNIQAEIEKQRAEERARWETEKQQYIGFPYMKQSGGLNQFLTQAFQ